MHSKIKVSYYSGNNRYDSVFNSLLQIKRDLNLLLKSKKKIIIKPNCVSEDNQLASTNKDTIKAVLDFISLNYNSKILIAEGSAYKTTNAFKNFNYYSLKRDYDVEFVDIDNDEFQEINIFKRDKTFQKVGISKTLLKSDCLISLAMLKTHDSVIGTYSIKNIAVGSLIKKTFFPYRINNKFLRRVVNKLSSTRNDKIKVHQGPIMMNKNIFEIYKKIKPTISVIDGWEGMEGIGPINGEKVDSRVALSSLNSLAADCISAKLMGLDPINIGYLNHCIKYEKLNLKDISLIGNMDFNNLIIKYKLPPNYKKQLKWK